MGERKAPGLSRRRHLYGPTYWGALEAHEEDNDSNDESPHAFAKQRRMEVEEQPHAHTRGPHVREQLLLIQHREFRNSFELDDDGAAHKEIQPLTCLRTPYQR